MFFVFAFDMLWILVVWLTYYSVLPIKIGLVYSITQEENRLLNVTVTYGLHIILGHEPEG